MGLTFQGAALGVGENIHERLRPILEERRAIPTDNHERGHRGGRPLVGT